MERWIVGNWKMNGSYAEISAFATGLRGVAGSTWPKKGVHVAVCPPYPYLGTLRQATEGLSVGLGAQNIHSAASGAYTGEVSAGMLRDLGAGLCIVGHSERRAMFKESNAFIGDKLKALQSAGLRAILCVGETLEEREAGTQAAVVQGQLAGSLAAVDVSIASSLLIAYEPVWAIGTGKTASAAQAQEMHAGIRAWLSHAWGDSAAAAIPLLYGGSVNAQNAASLFAERDVNGALVGGASLKAESFLGIIQHA
jgi:triosephosphate isomerase (TIM)